MPLCRDSAVVIGNGSPGPYWFTGFFVVCESDRVRCGDTVLSRDSDYAIDPNRGLIRLAHPIGAGDTLHINFTRLGWAFPTRLTLARVETGTSAGVDLNDGREGPRIIPASFTERRSPLTDGHGRDAGPTRPAAASSIRWGGFKSFALSAGTNSDPSWSQGLELSVDGELTPGLSLRAAISDRLTDNLDARHSSAAGTRLDRLDRLFIEARSSRFFGRWGEMTMNASPAAPTPRRAAGLQVRWDDSTHRAGAHLARAQGRWVRRHVPVRPGDAGPYALSRRPQIGGVVRGSASVWLDGQLLREGTDNDYTLDGSRGTITFTPAVTLTSASQCVVEYEEILDSYRRTLVGGDWSWHSTDRARGHRLSVAWEGDDPARLVSGTLSSDDRVQLAETDDGHVTTSTAEWVGRGRGDYRSEQGETGDTVFVYAGPENGEWRVRFTWVGVGQGRYRHLVNEVYEYLGPGLGAYEPVTVVEAPRSCLKIGEALALPLGQAGHLNAEWTGIASDPNRLRDGNTVFASNHIVGWTVGEPVETGTADGLQWTWCRQGHVDETGGGGSAFGRLVRVWNLRPQFYDTTFSEHSVSGSTSLSRFLGFSAAGGTFRSGSLSAWRGRGTGNARLGDRAGFSLSVARREAGRHDTEAPTDRSVSVTGKATFDPGLVRLEVGGGEERISNPGGLFDPRVSYAATRWISASRSGVIARHLWEKSIDTAAYQVRRAREFSLQVPAVMLGAESGSGLTVARGTESMGSAAATPYYRGRLHALWQPIAAATILAEMQLNRGSGGAQRVVYLPTRPGMGAYRWERGEYVPDAHGDFRRLVIDDNSVMQAAYDGARRITVRWRTRVAGWPLAIESRRESQGRYTPRLFRPGDWLALWRDPSAAMLPGSNLTTGEFHLVSVQPDAATDVDWQLTRDRRITAHNSTDVVAPETDSRIQTEIRLRRRFRNRSFAEGGAAYEERRRTGGPYMPVTAYAHTFSLMIGATNQIDPRRPAAAITASVQGRRRIDRDQLTAARVGLWGVRPVLRVQWRAFRLRASTDATWVNADYAVNLFSALLAEGRPLGFSITESAEVHWELPGRVTLKARLSGDHRQTGSDRWRMNVETVARF